MMSASWPKTRNYRLGPGARKLRRIGQWNSGEAMNLGRDRQETVRYVPVRGTTKTELSTHLFSG
jgi:hypothetical protein